MMRSNWPSMCGGSWASASWCWWVSPPAAWINPSVASYSSHLTDAESRQANALILRPRFYRGVVLELTHGFENVPPTMQKPKGFGTLGRLPLVVIRHGQPFSGPEAGREEGWTKAQTRL